ncbi:MAG: SusC/RagA family protein, partial [Bacteroidales bacterium]|nr:SusC/RagA family protein [Bacteroidales bacterium]
YGEILEPGGDAGMIRVKYTGEYDANGMPVRQIGPEDRQIMDIDPKLQGGFNTRVEYKNFDLNIIGAFQVGGKLICTLYAGRGYLNMLSGRRGNVDVDYFHAERDADGKLVKDANGNYTIYNRNADYPDPKTKTSGDNPQYASTLGFFDASYCKIRTITLGYNFKNNHIKWMDEAGIKKIRVYATVQNPFVIASKFHKETGLDPETNSRGNENVATGNASYRASSVLTIGTNTPSTRTFLFGLNVTF